MAEAMYRAEELAAKARQMFGTTPEIVTVALKTGQAAPSQSLL